MSGQDCPNQSDKCLYVTTYKEGDKVVSKALNFSSTVKKCKSVRHICCIRRGTSTCTKKRKEKLLICMCFQQMVNDANLKQTKEISLPVCNN